jgi:hypothetical protein
MPTKESSAQKQHIYTYDLGPQVQEDDTRRPTLSPSLRGGTALAQLINRRLTSDKITAIKVLRTNKAIRTVKNTWGPALRKRHQDLSPNWITRDEVF